MRVRMKTKIGGYRDGAEWPEPGEYIDVPAHEAADLIANGYAQEADSADENDDSAVDGRAPSHADATAPEAADGDGNPAADPHEAERTVVTLTLDRKAIAAISAAKKPRKKSDEI